MINRFLQSSNPNPAITWRVSTYKVGDPVLFNQTERFRPVIYNNLKGRIVDRHGPGQIRFDVELDRPLTEFDVSSGDLVGWGLDRAVLRLRLRQQRRGRRLGQHLRAVPCRLRRVDPQGAGP